MSQTVNIENSIYSFDVYLITKANPTGGQLYRTYPITKSSIKYLEINDSQSNMGYSGFITFTNFFNILQKLNSLNPFDESPYLYIKFSNNDFSSAGVTAPPVYLLATLGKSTETSANIIDKHITYEFEEQLVSSFKRTTMYNYLNDSAVNTSGTSDSPKSDSLTDTPANLIKKVLTWGSKIAGTATSISISGTPVDETISLISSGDITNQTSIFQSVENLTRYLCFTPKNTLPEQLKDFYSPGIVRLENTADYKKRQIIIKSLGDDIQTFLSLIKNNKSSSDIKNYLTEKFVVALSNDAATFRDNFIAKYNLMRVNYHDVYENKWCNYECVCGPPECSFNTITLYEELRVAFERIFTYPFATNIPKRETDVKNNSIKTIKYSIPNISEKLSKAYGANAIFKSFIFDNIALTFRVKGQPYRTSGKFIQIEADSSSTKSTSNKNSVSDELNGYWYIISVKHVFENDIYYNDYICVKVYSNYGSPTDPSSINAGSTITGGSIASSAISNSTTSSSSSSVTQNNQSSLIPGDDIEFELPFEGQEDTDLLNSEGLLPPLPQPSSNNSENIRSPLERQINPEWYYPQGSFPELTEPVNKTPTYT